MTLRTKIILSAVGAVLVLGILTYRSTTEYLSCVGCRGFRQVTERSFFGIQISKSEFLKLSASVPAGHVHEWWRYSLHASNAMGTGLACRPHCFADGKDK